MPPIDCCLADFVIALEARRVLDLVVGKGFCGVNGTLFGGHRETSTGKSQTRRVGIKDCREACHKVKIRGMPCSSASMTT